MRTYALRRLLLIIPVLMIVTIGVSSMMRLVPGDPATLALGQAATEEDRERFREAYHLNDSLPVQYVRWWSDVFRGNLGESVVQRTNVTDELKARLPSTVELLVFAMILTILIGVPFGIISAVRQNTPIDYFIRVMSIGGLSIPNFWLGTLLLTMPAIWWNYLPPLSKVAITDDPLKNLEQYFLPSLTLAIGSSAGIMRLTRSSMLEVLRNDYVRTAYAKGLKERVVIVRHTLKNALIPVVTVLGLQFAGLIGGAVIIETIFNLQGVGLFFINSIFFRDYPVIQGLVLFLAVVFLLVNLAVDLSYGILDPRIRYS
jgi:peptide/nickel transport system permease protein